ncbi:MAG TPA: hypothetical protein VJN96_02620 [Vicinamibacterales bacterium]|nr:hypothetical protein [Vicinamibacterales bacterium]
MSPDELMVTIGSGLFGLIGWIAWAVQLFSPARTAAQRRGVWSLVAAAIASLAIVVAVLFTWSASDVRNDSAYLAMYTLLGLAWLRIGELFFVLAGVSSRDDVVERGNAAAVPAIGGALIAIACCYAGGNVGEGPGWWVVVFSAALSSAALVVVWIVYDQATGIFETVTIDRDRAAGIRLGGFLVACGLVLGRAVAGNWVDVGQTIADFARVAWAVPVLFGAAIAIERTAQPTPQRPDVPVTAFGVAPAAVFIIAAAAYVVWLGPPA